MTYNGSKAYRESLEINKGNAGIWREWLQWEAARLMEKYQRLNHLTEEQVALVVWCLDKNHCRARYDSGYIRLKTIGNFEVYRAKAEWRIKSSSLGRDEYSDPLDGAKNTARRGDGSSSQGMQRRSNKKRRIGRSKEKAGA